MSYWQLTNEIRVINKINNWKIQQKWVKAGRFGTETEWRDVPVIEGDKE